MTKQTINTGATPNDKQGDSLRGAFTKINSNFTELYTALGLNVDGTLNIGAFEFAGSVMSTTDSSAIVIDQATTVTSNLTVGGDIVPQTALGGNLGSAARPWKSLYVSTNTIYLGGTALSINRAGNLTVNGSLITGGGVSSYADLTNKPTIPTSFSSLVNSTKTVSLGSDGVLTLPDGYLKIVPNGANPYIGNNTFADLGGGDSQSTVSAIQISQSVADNAGINIDTSVTSSLSGGTYLAAGSSMNVNGTRIVLGPYTVNSLGGGGPNLFTQNKIEINNNATLIGQYVSNTAEGNTITAFTGWTFGRDGKLLLPGGNAQIVVEDNGVRIGTGNLSTAPSSHIRIGGADHAFEIFGGPPGYSWKFDTNGVLKLPNAGELRPSTTAYDAALAVWESIRGGEIASKIANGQALVQYYPMVNWYPTGTTAQGYIDFLLNAWVVQQTGGATLIIQPAMSSSFYAQLRYVLTLIRDSYNASTKAVSLSSAYGQSWNFGTDGSLTLPGDIKSNGNINIDINLTDSTLRRWQFGEDGILTLPSTGKINNGNYEWQFGTNGGLTLPGYITSRTGLPLNIFPSAGSNGSFSNSTGSIGLFVNDTAPFITNGNNSWTFGSTGNTTFPTGLTLGAPRGVNTVNFTAAVNKEFQIETGTATSGKLWQFGTNGSLTLPGDIKSNGNINIDINLADSTLRRWQFGEDGHLTLPAGGDIKDITGTSVLGGGGGSTLVNGAYTASLGNTGALTLPAGGIISEGNSPTGVGKTITLTPYGVSATQALLIYPTGGVQEGDHIHLTAGGGNTELYLGNDNQYVKLVNGGNIEVRAYQPTSPYNTAAWTFGTDGSLAGDDEFTIKTPDGVPTSVYNWIGQGGWNQGYYSSIATTGGSGTGLTVNVAAGGGGYISINQITISNPGTGYKAGDAITINNENNLPGSFQIGVSGTRSWQFGIDGNLSLPSNGSIQSANPNTRAMVKLNPYRVLSQVRTSIVQTYSVGGGAFTSATSDGTGTITFVGLEGYVAEYFVDNLDNPTAVEDKRVQINATATEYEYFSFNNPDQILLNGYPTAPPAGAVTSITVKYTRVSKIDISPDDGVFNIQSELGQDIDINAGRYLDIVAARRVTMTAGDEMRLRSGNGNPVIISTNYPGLVTPTLEWQFGSGGELTLPYGAVLRNTAEAAVAFGQGAGLNSQSTMAIAIGTDAGYYTQGAAAVAIGESAGENYQGVNAIAIGKKAGYNNQAANSIILNATGNPLEQTTANTFTVAPIRNISATSGVLQYNASTKEVSYSNRVTAESFNTDQITVVGNRISTTVTNANLELECNGSGGVVINTLADATTSSTVKSVGYLGLPQSATATTATLAIGDAGKHIYITTTGQTITIPAASSVAYPIGTTLTFIAGPSATTVTIAITSDTLRLAGGTSTGSRTLAANGMATAVKVSGTSSAGVWYINGTGLT
jgi:hypothetical protein